MGITENVKLLGLGCNPWNLNKAKGTKKALINHILLTKDKLKYFR